MSTAKGYLEGYNAQAVANKEQVIVGAEVTDEQNDLGQLHPMIDATEASLVDAGVEDRPEKLLVDAGYCSEENLAAMDDDDPDTYVVTRNMKKNQIARTGRRGPLKKDATLVDQMDRKVSNKSGRALYR
ncbi:MAG: transposase, partial [Acidimicrobiales bacterium]